MPLLKEQYLCCVPSIVPSKNELAGITALAPKPESLVLYDVRCFALHTLTECNCPMRRELACRTNIPLLALIYAVPRSDLYMVANPLGFGATKPGQRAEHVESDTSHLRIIKCYFTDGMSK